VRGFVDGLVHLAPVAIQSAAERAIEDDVSRLCIEDLNLVEDVLSTVPGQWRFQALSDTVRDAEAVLSWEGDGSCCRTVSGGLGP
jgi:hypothetical protein